MTTNGVADDRRVLVLTRTVVAVLAVACRSSTPAPETAPTPAPPVATPVPATPEPVVPSDAALTRFAYAPGTAGYDVRTESTIELAGTRERETVATAARVTYTVVREARGAVVTGQVDSIAVQASARVTGGAGDTRLRAPVRFRGTVDAPTRSGGAAARTPPIALVDGAPRCALPDGSMQATALAAARETVIRIPPSIPVGGEWRDSVTTPGCSGAIPTTVTTVSRYEIVGQTTVDGVRAVRVRRSTSTAVQGQGITRGSQVGVTGSGSGEGSLVLDPIGGRLLSADGETRGTVRVTVGQQVAQEFAQQVKVMVRRR